MGEWVMLGAKSMFFNALEIKTKTGCSRPIDSSIGVHPILTSFVVKIQRWDGSTGKINVRMSLNLRLRGFGRGD
jgi:hypothetical protein